MVQRIELTRVFVCNGVRLPDPDPAMDVEKAVRLIAMGGRPELMSCEIRGPETVGTEQYYHLHRAVGTKGARARPEATARGKSAKVLQRIDALRKATQQRLARADAEVLEVLSANKGANGLVLPSHSVPWLG